MMHRKVAGALLPVQAVLPSGAGVTASARTNLRSSRPYRPF